MLPSIRRSTPFGLLALVAVIAGLGTGVSAFGGGESAPAAMGGHVVTLRLYSPALRRRERVLVYVPPGYATAPRRRYPLLLLLHGVPARPEDFVTQGAVDRIDSLIAAGRIPPMIVAMPAGSNRPVDDNEWADSAIERGQRWETYLAADVVSFLERSYRTGGKRSARAIAGISMGGFGAMNVALHHRDEFAAVGSWSGYFTANTPSVHGQGRAEWLRYSPQRYASTLSPSLAGVHPAISFYAGSRDGFYGENVAFDRLLTRLRVPHRFTGVAGGGHNWALWSARLDDEITFLAGAVHA
jgi:S-formylglutathione hydrolase FrmB